MSGSANRSGALVDSCREFWCEVADAAEIAASPSLGKYGLATEPLSSRLDRDQLRALHATARVVDVDPTTLEGLRPWLAGQLLESAHRARAGVDATADVHDALLSLARDSGKEIRTELPDAEATLAFFANLGDVAEIEYLMWTLDRVAEQGAEIRGRSQRGWSATDPSPRPRSSRCRGSIPPSTGACWSSETKPGCHASSRCCASPAARSYSSAIRTCPDTTGYRPCSRAVGYACSSEPI